MPDYKVERVLDIKALLGECPLWSSEDQALVWLDINRRTINRFTPGTGTNRAWPLTSMPGCFVLRAGHGAILAMPEGIFDFDFGTGELTQLAKSPFDPEHYRFNDGKPDRQGRLWAGSFLRENSQQVNESAMYRFDGTTLQRGFSIKIANGTAFSPDGRTMYRAESFERTIYALDYDPQSGKASNERVFSRIPQELGIPDGATVDTSGAYWVALPLGPVTGAIARITPDGKMDFHFDVPVLAPTMVAFGGPRMSTLYITSVGDDKLLPAGKAKGEMAGDIFAVETSFTGVIDSLAPRRS